MLVLSRKLNEKIHIGDGIIVTITHLDRNKVRLGIEAPDNVRILRGELAEWGYEPKRSENKKPNPQLVSDPAPIVVTSNS